MSKHTPGPWIVNFNHANGQPEFIRAFIYDDLMGGEMYDIANVWCDETGEAEANAKLIASAPDLLAFAERIATLAERSEYLHLIDEARAVVSKATGCPLTLTK